MIFLSLFTMLGLGGLRDWCYETLGYHCCCVTVAVVENMLMRLCAGICNRRILIKTKRFWSAVWYFILVLANGEAAGYQKKLFWFSVLEVKIRQHFLNLNYSRVKRHYIFSTAVSETQHYRLLSNSHLRFYHNHMIHRVLVSWTSKVRFFLRSKFEELAFLFGNTTFPRFLSEKMPCLSKISLAKAILKFPWNQNFKKWPFESLLSFVEFIKCFLKIVLTVETLLLG